MANKKSVDLDKLVVKAEEVPQPPMAADPPEGWPPLYACDGRNWYEKAMVYQAMTGRQVLPLKYKWDEDGNIVLREENTDNGTGDQNS